MVDKQAFFKEPLLTERLTVPGLGEVVVHEMTGLERAQWAGAIKGDSAEEIIRSHALLLVYTIRDDAGTPVFTTDDVDALLRGSHRAFVRMVRTASRVNALREEEQEALRGNSGADPSAGSTTNSP